MVWLWFWRWPSCHASARGSAPGDGRAVRCAIIGGMTMTGLWAELAKRFEAESGYRVEVVATGPRPVLDQAMRAGKVDLLTMHSGDITTDLVADGFGVNMRPWTRNELCILGPPEDPAGVRGMTNGAAALRKIAAAKSRFVDFQGIGSRELVHTLWRLGGNRTKGGLGPQRTTRCRNGIFCAICAPEQRLRGGRLRIPGADGPDGRGGHGDSVSKATRSHAPSVYCDGRRIQKVSAK